MRNRFPYIALAISFFIFCSYVLLPSSTTETYTSDTTTAFSSNLDTPPHVPSDLLRGAAIMPTLGNETIKQELGRASWKLLHTMLSRYPKSPSKDEREALHSYILLFGRLYPCGECAQHFQEILQKFPPQTSSRDSASQWGCFVHNLVSERLKKEAFDCSKVTEHYKCGCADADEEEKEEEEEGAKDTELGLLEENVKKSSKVKGARVDMEDEGPTNGG